MLGQLEARFLPAKTFVGVACATGISNLYTDVLSSVKSIK